MKFSESQHYIQYINSKAAGDIEAAKQAVQACLDTPEFNKDTLQHAYLLQVQGNLYLDANEKQKALHCYEKAEALNPIALPAMYFFAKFLAEKMGDKEKAIAKCDQIAQIANQQPSSSTSGNNEEYAKQAKALKNSICVC